MTEAPSLCILDTDRVSACDGVHLHWRTWDAPDGYSIPTLQDTRQKKTQAEYLAWLHAFAETPADGMNVRERLRLSDGFSAWWLTILFTRHPELHRGALFEIFKLRALEEFIKEKDFRHIVLDSPDPRLRAVVSAWCAHTGRTCRLSSPPQKMTRFSRSVRNAWRNTPPAQMYQAGKELLHWWKTERRFFPKAPASLPQNEGCACATWFPNVDMEAAAKGAFISNYWGELCSLLEAQHIPVHWLLIHYEGAAKCKNNIALRDGFLRGNTPGSLLFWEECTDARTLWRVWRNRLRVLLAARALDAHIPRLCAWPDSDLNIAPYILPLWRESTRGAWLTRQLLLYEGIAAWAHLIGRQKAVFAPSELQGWERALYRHMRKQGTDKLYAAMHSVAWPLDTRFAIDPRSWDVPEFREQMPEIFLCNGSRSQAEMRQSGFPVERLGAVEALRYQHLAPPTSSTRIPSRLLVVTSIHKNEVAGQLRTLAEALSTGEKPFQNILLKAHPGFPVEEELRRYFPEGGAPETVTDPLRDLLTPATMVYAANSTTAAVEAAYLGLPLVVQAADDNFNLSPLAGQKGVRFVHNAAELSRALHNPPFSCVERDFFFLEPELPRWQSILQRVLQETSHCEGGYI